MTQSATGTIAVAGEQASPAAAGLDVGSRHERDADEVAHRVVELLEADPATHGWRDTLVVSTHFVGRHEGRHVALSVTAAADGELLAAAVREAADRLRAELPDPERLAVVAAGAGTGPDDVRIGAEEALQAGTARSSGRAVHYPGVRSLTGETTVGDLLAASAIERVRVLAGGDPAPQTPFVTREFVRPVWLDGSLVLHAQPARGGVLVPFEVPNPTPCCADHG